MNPAIGQGEKLREGGVIRCSVFRRRLPQSGEKALRADIPAHDASVVGKINFPSVRTGNPHPIGTGATLKIRRTQEELP
jgi:hypothetical protein